MGRVWVASREDWVEGDASVPPGWKLRRVEGTRLGKNRTKLYLLSPGGDTFQTRLKAAQELRRRGEAAAELVAVLGEEGWAPHYLLPQGWLVRPHPAKPISFLSPGLEVLGLGATLAHMEEAQEYGEEERERVAAVARNYNSVKAEEKVTAGWEAREDLPEGWSVRSGLRGSQELLLSPQGVELRGRLGAIRHLLREGAAAEERVVAVLRAGLLARGWEASEGLPAGWLQRRTRRKEAGLQFLSPQYRDFSGLTRVYHHLKARRAAAGATPAMLADLRRRLTLRDRLSNRRTNAQTKGGKKWGKTKYVAEEGLPEGWKVAVRRFKYGQQPRESFLSPSGLQLPLAVLAFQLMVEEGASSLQLEPMLPRLEREGWKEQGGLPAGWRIHLDPSSMVGQLEVEEEGAEVVFLTGKGQLLGQAAAMGLLEEEGWEQGEVAGLANLVRYLRSGLAEAAWEEHRDLPREWRVWREVLGYKVQVHVATPEGRQFDSLLEAYTAMADNRRKHTMGEMEGMRRLLGEEGWEEVAGLPWGWLMARARGDSLFQLVSREGRVFETLYEAQEWMEGRGAREYPGDQVGGVGGVVRVEWGAGGSGEASL